jgi:hypothetical protein
MTLKTTPIKRGANLRRRFQLRVRDETTHVHELEAGPVGLRGRPREHRLQVKEWGLPQRLPCHGRRRTTGKEERLRGCLTSEFLMYIIPVGCDCCFMR